MAVQGATHRRPRGIARAWSVSWLRRAVFAPSPEAYSPFGGFEGLASGMGRPAYTSLKASGLEPIITDIVDIDEAVQAFIDGAMDNRTERLH